MKSAVFAEHHKGTIMERLRLLLFLSWAVAAWAGEGITGFPESATDPNDMIAETKTEEPNVIELVPIEATNAIELTAAPDILQPKYHLLPLKTELFDDKSLPIFMQVFYKDPNQPESEPNFDLVDQLLKQDTKEVYIEFVHELLEKYIKKLELLRKASLSGTVEWPVMRYSHKASHMHMNTFPEMMPGMNGFGASDLPAEPEAEDEQVTLTPSEYLDFLNTIQGYGKLIALKSRYHIVQHQYDEAVIWLRTGLNISRQMVQNSNAQLGLMAASNAAVSLQQIELWVQMPDSPSLYRNLQDLPSPLLNTCSLQTLIEKKVVSKLPRAGKPFFYEENVKKEESEITYYSSELLHNAANRIDRFIAILECLEGLRYYAALYGQLPDSLFEVTEIRLPKDPITNRPFLYHKESDVAILHASDIRDVGTPSVFRYTIRMKPISRD